MVRCLGDVACKAITIYCVVNVANRQIVDCLRDVMICCLGDVACKAITIQCVVNVSYTAIQTYSWPRPNILYPCHLDWWNVQLLMRCSINIELETIFHSYYNFFVIIYVSDFQWTSMFIEFESVDSSHLHNDFFSRVYVQVGLSRRIEECGCA